MDLGCDVFICITVCNHIVCVFMCKRQKKSLVCFSAGTPLHRCAVPELVDEACREAEIYQQEGIVRDE